MIAAVAETLESLVRRVMVRVAMIDGQLRATEMDRLRWNVGRLTGRTPDETRVRCDIEEVVARAVPLSELLAEAREQLDAEGRRTVMRAAYIIATADGEVPAAEETMLVEIARGLGIEPAEYRALVSPMALARVLAKT